MQPTVGLRESHGAVHWLTHISWTPVQLSDSLKHGRRHLVLHVLEIKMNIRQIPTGQQSPDISIGDIHRYFGTPRKLPRTIFGPLDGSQIRNNVM